MNKKNVMITTQHRGVFLAQVSEDMDLTTKTLENLQNCRMVIRWRNGKGLTGMANSGPTSECKLSPLANIPVLHDVTAVMDVTDEAAAKIWTNAEG